MTFTDEPEVLTWMIALAGDRRPRPGPTGRHWWREMVTDAWRCADEAWRARCEAVAIGYETEEREFAALHPRPTLGGFMRALSTGQIAPETAMRGAA